MSGISEVSLKPNGTSADLEGKIAALEQALNKINSEEWRPREINEKLGELGLSALLHSVGIQSALKQSLSREMVEGNDAIAKRRRLERRRDLAGLLKAAKDEDVQSLTGVYLEGAQWDNEPFDWLWGMSNTATEQAAACFCNRKVEVISGDFAPGVLETVLHHWEKWRSECETTLRELNTKDKLGFADRLAKRDELEHILTEALTDVWKLREGIDFKVVDGQLTDLRRCRLYIKLDLSEWLQIKNRDILHVVDEEPGDADGYAPLGRTTVWVHARAQVKHVRSKTAKTYIRGQIADRLRIEDLESNVGGFVNKIFDTDSEMAYSSTNSPC